MGFLEPASPLFCLQAAREIIATCHIYWLNLQLTQGKTQPSSAHSPSNTAFRFHQAFDLRGEPRNFVKVRSSLHFIIFASFSDIILSVVLVHVLLIKGALSSHLEISSCFITEEKVSLFFNPFLFWRGLRGKIVNKIFQLQSGVYHLLYPGAVLQIIFIYDTPVNLSGHHRDSPSPHPPRQV